MPRKQKTIHYIYKTTCKVTGRYYIGMHSTCNIDDGYMGSGKRLRRSIRKYGVENHNKEILEFFETRELLIEAEKKVITPEMITDKNCMNLKEGGIGGFSSEEHKKKFLESASKTFTTYKNEIIAAKKILWGTNKEWAAAFSKKLSDKAKGNKSFLNKTHSIETKNKISKAHKGLHVGKLNTQYGTCWITKNGVNRKIKKEELKEWIKNGWESGRVVK